MPSGSDLRSSVTFAEPTGTSDEFGNVLQSFTDRFTVRAQITPRLGGEAVEAARLEGRQPVIVHVRHSPDTVLVRTNWRVTDVDTGVAYNVRAVADPKLGESTHGQWIDMLAEAGVAI